MSCTLLPFEAHLVECNWCQLRSVEVPAMRQMTDGATLHPLWVTTTAFESAQRASQQEWRPRMRFAKRMPSYLEA